MLAIRLAWRNIWRNKRRTVITTLSIVVAVFLSAITRASQEGQYDNMIDSTVGTFTGYIQVHQEGYWDEPNLDNSLAPDDSLYSMIRSLPGIAQIVPRIESYALAANTEQSRPAMVMGIDVEAEQELAEPQDRLREGSYFQTNNEQGAIIGFELAERLHAAVGDSLVLIGQGYHGTNATGLYPIKGIVGYASPELNSTLVFLPLETARDFFVAQGRATTLAITLDDPRTLNNTIRQLQDELPQNQFEVMGWNELMPGLEQAIEADRGSGIIILGVLYMVVGFGILGTVLMMIAERSYEFGVMLSVGTPRWTLTKILSMEVLFLAMLGAGFGILISIPVAWYFNVNPIELQGAMESAVQQYNMEPILQFSVDPSIFIGQAIAVFFVTLLFSALPIIKAALLNPVEAMRS